MKTELDPAAAIALLGELVRLTAPPATQDEICDQGLGVLARALGFKDGILLLRDGTGSATRIGASRGADLRGDLVRAATAALEFRDGTTPPPHEAPLTCITLALPDEGGPMGVVVFVAPQVWDPVAASFARSGAGTLAASLRVARIMEQSRSQRELLARRNVALETLRELAGRLQGILREDEMLQAALDLVLEKLGLSSGWIFWGEEGGGRLDLAAARGISEEFVRQSREKGVGTCLCQDVFTTGRLMFARNTLDCPRMPDLHCPGGEVSHACVPLKFERGILGVMNIANRPGQVFTPQELQFLETVGNQVCLAVDKSRTAHAESRRNAEARALVSLARAIGGSLERERVLAAVGDYARELLAADRCAIFLGDVSARPLFAYLTGPPLAGLEVGKSADFAEIGSRALLGAFRQRRTLVFRNAFEDPQANPELARLWEIGSGVLIPLVAHGQFEGLLVATRSRPSAWSAEELALADALAAQAAVSIENARLYREAQEALLRLQQAQYGMMRAERMAAIGTLAASLAHEVRNPLNSINLQLVLLSRRVGGLGESKRTELNSLIDTAQREITRLDGLVEEFLSLASIDRLSLAETDPNGVIREVAALMAPVAKEKRVSIREELTAELPRIRLDGEKIKQVLINLVRNAIEAMTDGGMVCLSTASDDSSVTIRVADTGPGIEPGLDVFDFFMTTKRGGTGLGLPIARRIVEAHGGSLTYETATGRGTTFTVALKSLQDAYTPRERPDHD